VVGQQPASALKVSVVIPELYHPDGKLLQAPTLRNAGYGLKFFVVVENVSAADLYIWAEGNSVGDSTLSFDVTGSDGVKKLIKRIEQEQSKNFIKAERLAPDGYQVRAIEYDNDPKNTPQWEKFPFGAKYTRREVTLRAIFEQPKKDNGEKLAIWSGKVVSAPCKVVLENE
jgi:hypothetical protein